MSQLRDGYLAPHGTRTADAADTPGAPDTPGHGASSGDRPVRLTTGLTTLMAVGAGIAAASTYYVQPLLSTLADYFGVSSGAAGLVSTLGQLGYAVGLALLVPLGDMLERRRLILVLTGVSALALLGMALAPNLEALMVFALVVGASTITAQIFVPFAAQLATDSGRGRAIGRIMGGLLVGILLARTFAGVIADVASWRIVFASAALLTAALGIACRVKLPRSRPTHDGTYGALLTSTMRIFLAEPVLRRRGLYGALVFASFGTFWTVVSFRLAGYYHYNEAVIGLLGLVGVAGAACAQFAGRLADMGWARVATVGFVLVAACSWVAIFAGGWNLAALIIGILALDMGVQGTHISNQSEVYRLRPEARSRLTTGYMCCYYAGGVTGTALAGLAYASWGWGGVCVVGAIYPLAALGVWLTEARWPLTRLRRGRAT